MSSHKNPAPASAAAAFASALVLALALAPTPAQGASAARAAAADPARWAQQPLPGSPAGNLLSVAQLDAQTTWAAGFRMVVTDGAVDFHPLLVARSGGADAPWRTVPTPADAASSRINAVSADGPDDVWLVGDSDLHTASGSSGILAEHWDGTAWSVHDVPADTTGGANLLGVAAISPNDAWAVGQDMNTGTAFIEHWDGGTWTDIAPASGTAAQFAPTSIVAIDAHDIWIGGLSNTDGTAALMHYDGTTLTEVTHLPGAGDGSKINAVAAGGSGDVYAVGRQYLSAADSYGHPLVEHWDGTRWSAVATPWTTTSGWLYGATVTEQGLTVVGGALPYPAPLGAVLGGDGRWTGFGLPNVGSTGSTSFDGSTLMAVTAGDCGVVAVGGYYDEAGDQDGYVYPLILTALRQ